MNSFLKSSVRVAIASATLLVLGATTLAASAAIEIPFTGTYLTAHDDDLGSRDGVPGLVVDTKGMGWATLLGESTCVSEYQFMYFDGSGVARYILRGRGRDTLVLELVAKADQHKIVSMNQIMFGGTFTVTGTGRYRGVTGGGVWSGTASFDEVLGSLPNSGTGGWAFWGEIEIDRRLVHGCGK